MFDERVFVCCVGVFYCIGSVVFCGLISMTIAGDIDIALGADSWVILVFGARIVLPTACLR